jgi:hypothetical protein
MKKYLIIALTLICVGLAPMSASAMSFIPNNTSQAGKIILAYHGGHYHHGGVNFGVGIGGGYNRHYYYDPGYNYYYTYPNYYYSEPGIYIWGY